LKLLLNKTSELNGKLQKNQLKRFNLPCEGKTKELQRRKETKENPMKLSFLLDACVFL